MDFATLTSNVLSTLWDLISAIGGFSSFILNIFINFPAPFNFFFGLFATYLVAMVTFKVASFIAKFIPFLG